MKMKEIVKISIILLLTSCSVVKEKITHYNNVRNEPKECFDPGDWFALQNHRHDMFYKDNLDSLISRIWISDSLMSKEGCGFCNKPNQVCYIDIEDESVPVIPGPKLGIGFN